jgi:leader peptidase (prepilin peptidase)/N-methyltransferase
MEIVLAVFAGLVGVLVGGLINALADDLPDQRNPRLPHYPDGIPRPVSAWLGITAFVTGQRESPATGDPVTPDLPESGEAEAVPVPRRLGWRYPLVEIVSGLMFAGMALGLADEPNLPFWFVYVAILLLITVIDIEHRLILFVVILPSCLFALLVAAISPEEGRTFSSYGYGGLLGLGLFFAMYLGGGAFSALTRNEEVAFGFGDVMLATLSGLMIGWKAFIFASLITVFTGAAGAVLYLGGRLIVRRRYRWFTPLPYGPYIVIGTLVMLLLRDEVQQVIKRSVY